MENPPQIMRAQEGRVFILHSSGNSVKNEDPTPLFHIIFTLNATLFSLIC